MGMVWSGLVLGCDKAKRVRVEIRDPCSWRSDRVRGCATKWVILEGRGFWLSLVHRWSCV
jgi:hypothetical protein